MPTQPSRRELRAGVMEVLSPALPWPSFGTSGKASLSLIPRL